MRFERIVLGVASLGICGAASCEEATLPACVDAQPANTEETVILAAGDVLEPSDRSGAEATARLLDRMGGTVALLGDGVHEDGSLESYLDGYAKTWGRHRWRTKPAVGNHEYRTPHASSYFAYFCGSSGTPFDGWYSYDAGSWHVVVLNSACDDPNEDEACALGRAQLAWLRSDLAAHPNSCTLAYWHHPLFTSAPEGNALVLRETWQVLYDAGAELVLNGHAHYYERFAALSPDGVADPVRGIQEFVVGTGGSHLSRPGAVQPWSLARHVDVWGILRLELRPGAWEYRFVATNGAVLDEGSGSCH